MLIWFLLYTHAMMKWNYHVGGNRFGMDVITWSSFTTLLQDAFRFTNRNIPQDWLHNTYAQSWRVSSTRPEGGRRPHTLKYTRCCKRGNWVMGVNKCIQSFGLEICVLRRKSARRTKILTREGIWEVCQEEYVLTKPTVRQGVNKMATIQQSQKDRRRNISNWQASQQESQDASSSVYHQTYSTCATNFFFQSILVCLPIAPTLSHTETHLFITYVFF